MKPGVDFIGVGCGAVIVNEKNQVLIMKRGKKSKNRVGWWAIPGGAVDQGETAQEALKREVKEELGIEIEVEELLSFTDDLLLDEGQHWVTPQFLCRIITGTPIICEPDKCDVIKWVHIDDVKKLPGEITLPAINSIEALKKKLQLIRKK